MMTRKFVAESLLWVAEAGRLRSDSGERKPPGMYLLSRGKRARSNRPRWRIAVPAGLAALVVVGGAATAATVVAGSDDQAADVKAGTYNLAVAKSGLCMDLVGGSSSMRHADPAVGLQRGAEQPAVDPGRPRFGQIQHQVRRQWTVPRRSQRLHHQRDPPPAVGLRDRSGQSAMDAEGRAGQHLPDRQRQQRSVRQRREGEHRVRRRRHPGDLLHQQQQALVADRGRQHRDRYRDRLGLGVLRHDDHGGRRRLR